VLAGLTHHHQIPVLAVAAARGGLEDAFYYQSYKGRTTTPVLDALDVPWHAVHEPAGFAVLGDAYRQAEMHRRPVVLLADKAALA
jgi:sulfopyruvate decarboxylase subunit alpha